MQIVIETLQPVEIRRPAGSTVTFVNQSAIDVYLDTDRGRLLASLSAAVPSGTKVAANGGQVQITDFFGAIYARAAAQTTLEVLP